MVGCSPGSTLTGPVPVHRCGPAAGFTTWQASDNRFAGCGDLQAVIDRIRRSGIDESRQLCWALLDLAGRGDDLAVRVLLQTMIPGLVAEMARWLIDASTSPRTRYAFDGPGEAEQILVTEATQAITDLAAASATQWPIADLIRRAHRLTLRRIRAERAWINHNLLLADIPGHHSTGHDTTPARGPATTAEQLAAALVDQIRAGTITAVEGQIVWLTRSVGYRPGDIAGCYGLSPDTLRRRRHRIEARLAGAADRIA